MRRLPRSWEVGKGRNASILTPAPAERRETQVVKEGFPVFMVALIKLLIQSYGKLIQDVLLSICCDRICCEVRQCRDIAGSWRQVRRSGRRGI